MNVQATFAGKLVDVIAKSGGWSTILLDSGATRKVRNGQLTAPVTTTGKVKAAAPVALSGMPSATTKDTPAVKEATKRASKPKAERKARASNTTVRLRLQPKLAERYHVYTDAPTASGRPSVDISDEVADRLRGQDLADTYREASKATGRTQIELRARYEKLNPGMQRMNLGNLIRGAAKAAAKQMEKDKRASNRALAASNAKAAKAIKTKAKK